jgi:hypothetical protein
MAKERIAVLRAADAAARWRRKKIAKTHSKKLTALPTLPPMHRGQKARGVPSAGGDGGRRSPEHPATTTFAPLGSQRLWPPHSNFTGRRILRQVPGPMLTDDPAPQCRLSEPSSFWISSRTSSSAMPTSARPSLIISRTISGKKALIMCTI